MKTSLTLILPLLTLNSHFSAALPRSLAISESLQLDNGLPRGEWGPISLCSANSYVFAFEIKYSGVGYLDDTSVNAIRMYCQTKDGSLTGIITSSEGSFGQWKGMRPCPSGEFLTGVRANVVPEQGALGDDLGMDNLQMRCSGGKVLDGMNGIPARNGETPIVRRELIEVGKREVEAVYMKIQSSAHIRDFGDWGLWQACSSGNKVCGLEVRLEDNHVLDDDAGVTDLVTYCCA